MGDPKAVQKGRGGTPKCWGGDGMRRGSQNWGEFGDPRAMGLRNGVRRDPKAVG